MKFIEYIRARGLGAYMALAFSTLSIVLTLVLVEIIEVVATEQVKSNIGHSLAELALQTSDKLDRGMFERYREVRLMSRRADLVGQDTDNDNRRRIIEGLQETYPYYAWIGLAGLDGKVLAAGHRLLEGADVSKRPWFGNALRGIYLGDVHEAVLLAKLLPNPSNEPKRFVDVAFPYSGPDGKPLGVLGAHLSWQWAKDVEKSVIEPIAARRQVESLIIGTDGAVLLGPRELQGKVIAQNSFKQASTQPSGFLIENWPDGRSYLVGFSKSKGYENYPGLGWTILVRQNLDDAFAPVKRIQHRVLGSGIVLALVFSLVGLVVARRVTHPLWALAQSAQRIERGDAITIPPGTGSYYEVRALSSSLNGLVSNLIQREQDVHELNRTLEARVELRTRELEQALATVQASERRINSIIEAAQDAFIGVDLHGKISDWNTRAERMFGWSKAEAVGRSLSDLVIPDRYRDSYRKALVGFHQTGQIDFLQRRMERIVTNRHGTEFPIEMTVGLAGSRETYFFSAFLHDISERKKVEQMKSEFVSTVSHELRTPLTAIRASLALLADGTAGELPADTRGLVDIAYQSCERLVRLVNDVLDIQKIEAGHMEFNQVSQPLLPLVRQAVDAMQAYAQQYGVALAFDVSASQQSAQQPTLAAAIDRDRLLQVMTNLLSNAIKFSPQGASVEVLLGKADGKVRLSVIDHGPGIPAAFRERIFQKFAQADATDSRQKGGTGLGLSICKSIVEEHGGTIWFESEEGRGTRFHVDLPLTAMPAGG